MTTPRAFLRALMALAAGAACAWATPSAAQTVTRVRAQQLPDKTVEVLYDLAGAAAGGATVSVSFSSDAGASYPIVPQPSALSGHVGAGIASGADRRVVWNAAATLPAGTFGTAYRAAVTATNPTTPTPTPTPLPSGPCTGPITATLPGGVPMELACVKAQSFQMGSPDEESGHQAQEGPVHTVAITKDYYLGKTEVTQRQWQAVMGAPPVLTCQNGPFGVGDSYPVYCVTWTEVAGPGGFLDRLNQQLGTTKFRLPTEAEWELAARAGTGTRFSFGDAALCDETCGPCSEAEPHMWWCGNNNPRGARPVASKQANAFGLHDMHGGISELVNDWYLPSYYEDSPPADPPGPEVGLGTKVVRGGSWVFHLRFCRAAYRSFADKDSRFGDTGFRVARSQ